MAQADDDPNLQKFIEVAKSRVRTAEAAQAIRDGAPEAFFRWGREACQWVRSGKAGFKETTENLAQFFGDDRAAALVHSARVVVCPELKA